MPRPTFQQVVHFTLHAYGTWMPDRPQGYYKNRDGLREADDEEASRYRGRQRERSARFDPNVQRVIIEALHESARVHNWTLIVVGTDDCHVHLIAGWHDDRPPDLLQRRIKTTLTYHLNARVGRRTWFLRDGHDRRVRDREHFEYLRHVYVPSHRGVGWDRRGGWRETRREPDCGP